MGRATFPPNDEFPEGFEELFEPGNLDSVMEQAKKAMERGALEAKIERLAEEIRALSDEDDQ